jgi:hypothetical protein
MEILSKVGVWIIQSNFYIALIWLVIIGLVVLCLKAYFKSKDKKRVYKEAHLKGVLRKALNSELPSKLIEDLKVDTIKTVNIYKHPSYHKDFHNAMVRQIQKFLLMKLNYRLNMSEADLQLFTTWDCPVLVIVPSMKCFMYHGIQEEKRTATRSFNITSNDINSMETELTKILADLEAN